MRRFMNKWTMAVLAWACWWSGFTLGSERPPTAKPTKNVIFGILNAGSAYTVETANSFLQGTFPDKPVADVLVVPRSYDFGVLPLQTEFPPRCKIASNTVMMIHVYPTLDGIRTRAFT